MRGTNRKEEIERELPGAGNLFTGELRDISQTSCNVLNDLDPRIQ